MALQTRIKEQLLDLDYSISKLEHSMEWNHAGRTSLFENVLSSRGPQFGYESPDEIEEDSWVDESFVCNTDDETTLSLRDNEKAFTSGQIQGSGRSDMDNHEKEAKQLDERRQKIQNLKARGTNWRPWSVRRYGKLYQIALRELEVSARSRRLMI